MSAAARPDDAAFQLPDTAVRTGVTGPGERNLKMIREALGVRITARGDALSVTGDAAAVARTRAVLTKLQQAAERDRPLDRAAVLGLLADAAGRPAPLTTGKGEHHAAAPLPHDAFDVYLPGRTVRPQTDGQAHYTHAVVDHDLTFCTGPAGTGKTYLAVAVAVAMLKRGDVRKIVLCRPAVEAGEKIGFLPGTLQEKVNPYLRPLLDALHDMMDYENIQRLMGVDIIEIIPLAFMRGRTLNDACVILDEAQNTTRSQMLMFLTRMGHGSKMIVTGDTSQTDLDDPRDSGLVDAVRRLRRVRGIGMVTLGRADIVRHRLVQRVVEAYESAPPAPRQAPNRPDNTTPEHPAGPSTENDRFPSPSG